MELFLVAATFLILIFIIHGIVHRRTRAHRNFDELARQIVHAGIGLFVIAVAVFAGFEAAKYLVFSGLVVGIALAGIKAAKVRLPIIDRILHYFERPGFMAGYGAIAYFAGMLFALSYCGGTLGLYILYILAVCDAAATLFGKAHGKFQLPYNRSKSFEGLLAFLAFALPVVVLGGSPIVPVVLAAAILETVDLGIDDNVLVPLAGLIYGVI